MNEDNDDGGFETRCGDASNSPYTVSSIPDLCEHVSKLGKLSAFWSDVWIHPGGTYTHTPVMLWDVPFEMVEADKLLIGNSYDPATPLAAASKCLSYTNGVLYCSRRDMDIARLLRSVVVLLRRLELVPGRYPTYE